MNLVYPFTLRVWAW